MKQPRHSRLQQNVTMQKQSTSHCSPMEAAAVSSRKAGGDQGRGLVLTFSYTRQRNCDPVLLPSILINECQIAKLCHLSSVQKFLEYKPPSSCYCPYHHLTHGPYPTKWHQSQTQGRCQALGVEALLGSWASIAFLLCHSHSPCANILAHSRPTEPRPAPLLTSMASRERLQESSNLFTRICSRT